MILSLALVLLRQQTPVNAPNLLAHIGDYHRKVSSKPLAQKYFDQGMSLFYAFHKTTSTRFFQQAEILDPSCAMNYWGEALSYAPDINFTAVDEESNKKALAALEKAKALAKAGLEADLVDAMSVRYASPAPADRSSLDKAYMEKMKALYAKYPKDADVASLYAESVMILSPWHQWEADGSMVSGTQDAIEAIQHALKLSPRHLMANHLWIHVMEAGPRASEALGSADLLCNMAPDLGHLVHMPSHIYVRTGKWAKAIEQNKLAIIADRTFTKDRGLVPTYLPYMGHNRMMLAYAGAMSGDYAAAQWAFSDWNKIINPLVIKEMGPMIDWIMSMPQDIDKRFGHWDKVLAYPEPVSNLPITKLAWRANRAVAYAATGHTDLAHAEFEAFKNSRGSVNKDVSYGNNTPQGVLDVYEHVTAGEIALAENRLDAAVEELKAGMKAEDRLRYDEPPDWTLPVRHTLGAVYLKMGKPTDAILVYKQDLAKTPDNVWSLVGIANAYHALGQHQLAAQWTKKLKAAQAKNAEGITTSCLCVPGK